MLHARVRPLCIVDQRRTRKDSKSSSVDNLQLNLVSSSSLSSPARPHFSVSAEMLIPKKNRKTIYEHLFKEGVLVAKKDFFAPKHPEIETVPNLQVIKAMQVR